MKLTHDDPSQEILEFSSPVLTSIEIPYLSIARVDRSSKIWMQIVCSYVVVYRYLRMSYESRVNITTP